VVELVDETARTKSVVLDVPGWRGHRAGQHVDVRLTAEDGYQAQRSYSIVSAPQLPAPVVRQSSLERIPGRRQLEDLHNLDAQLALVDELCQCDQLVPVVLDHEEGCAHRVLDRQPDVRRLDERQDRAASAGPALARSARSRP
jgi:hypothetical protein